MTTNRFRTVLVRLASVALVLLLGGTWVGAQEQQKEPPKKVEERAKRGGETKAKPPAKQAQPQQAAKPKPEAPPQQNRGKQEAAPPSASRPAQQTPTDLRRGQPPAQRPPEAAPRVVQPPAQRPTEAAPRVVQPQSGRAVQPQGPPPNVLQRGEHERPPQGGRPAMPEARGEAQRGAPRNAPANASSPLRVFVTRGGDAVRRDPAGHVSEVRMKTGAVVYHAPNGLRRVEVVRPGNRVIVADAPGRGYVQRPIVIRDHRFYKRTYYYGGVPYARVYRPVTYRGAVFEIYTPVRYYRPAYYTYVFNPWPAPVVWSWGWGGSPWFGFYGGYFTPYRYYRSPAFWLTDFFIASTLQAAYQDRIAAGMAPAPVVDDEVVLSPEVKDLVADEVRRQLERERAESQAAGYGYSSDDAPMWADGTSHVFVAYRPLGVNSSEGYCTIGEGDVLQLNRMPPPYSPTADLVVLASRRHDCRRGSIVSLRLNDLQDMSNRMRETVDAGLNEMQSHQGQAGMPALPAGAVGTVDTPLAAEATPDGNVGADLSQAYRDTDQAEQAALNQVGNDPGDTPTVSLGQTMDQVRAVLGPPQQIMNAGSKQIYIYQNLKVTFINGRVSDID